MVKSKEMRKQFIKQQNKMNYIALFIMPPLLGKSLFQRIMSFQSDWEKPIDNKSALQFMKNALSAISSISQYLINKKEKVIKLVVVQGASSFQTSGLMIAHHVIHIHHERVQRYQYDRQNS